jgi:hypothetical protein
MYDLITPMPLVNPCDSKGMITDEYIDFLKGSQIQTKGKTLEFEIHSLKQKIYFKVSDNLDQSYTIVGPAHFKNIETQEVVILDIHKPNLSIDMNKIQKATQVDLDSYQCSLKKNNDNCKLYNLINNIVQMNDSSDESDEDPYYRGNIEDFLKNSS